MSEPITVRKGNVSVKIYATRNGDYNFIDPAANGAQRFYYAERDQE